MEIKVGEYVRTIDGYIRKVVKYNEKGTHACICFGACETDEDYKNSKGISLKKIKKHSPNIINLIEVGDYVNGQKVLDFDWSEVQVEGFKFIPSNEFKSIVTHEQFSEMEYKV